jgi:class 3 adenylate cyclase
MVRTSPSRTLTTILVLDIVGSTGVAADLGDRRWRDLLHEFRRIVRAELKRHHGRDQGTAGDSFFATFTQPLAAVRAAAAIVRSVQSIGLDVRCGVHFGETETIQAQPGGIAVHIGSRVMSLGGAAQVLVTGTVRELISGADVQLVDAGTHALKGVPGEWHVWNVAALDGAPLPDALPPERGAELRASASTLMRRRRAPMLAAIAALVLLVIGGGAFAVVLAQAHPPTLLRIDPKTNAISMTVTDAYRSEHYPNGLWAVNGALWQAAVGDFTGLVRRDMQTGNALQTIAVTGDPVGGAFGFGSIWIAGLDGPGTIDRWDAVTGRKLARVSLDGEIISIDAGPAAVWALTKDARLHEIDPISSRVVGSFATGAVEPGIVVALEDRVWVCACSRHTLYEFDPARSKVVRVIDTAARGFLVGLADTSGVKTLWLLDFQGAALTPIDVASGKPGQPIGIGANLHGATVGFGSIWVARGDQVIRLRGDGPEVVARIPMPRGMSAGAIAIDEASGSLWVADCGCPIE